ncbi:LLM class flavin-dependent oxidoreductase [Sphaerisporangium rufum]|nr:LLM class flavin-dependent oxidoreductase [Sphaerisporangium rufum]
MVTLAPDDLAVLRRRVAACERAGFAALGIGDSPGYHDVHVALTVAAQVPARLRIGPMVTNVVTRTPQVTARALHSVDEIAGGRVFAGVGGGDSALAGAAGAGVAGLAAGLGRLREHWPAAGVPGPDRPWRLVVAANGPRTLALGGAMADLVVSGAGITAEAVRRARTAVAAGERRAGRAPGSVPLWAVARVAVAGDRETALAGLLPLLASGANHVFRVPGEARGLPPEVAAGVATLRARYDYAAHGHRTGNPNAALVERLGLREPLAERFAIAGTAAQVAAGLRELSGRGVDGVVIPAVGLDVDDLLARLGEEVLPLLGRHAGR